MDQTLDLIGRTIDSGGSGYVCCVAAHSLIDAYHDRDLRQAFNQSLIATPDGMPLVWLCRLAGHRLTSRVYGPDLLLAACRYGVERGWRHFLLGANPETLANLRRRLEIEAPDVIIQGSLSPDYSDPAISSPDPDAVEAIDQAKVDIVWVGLGTGKQEHWMASHVDVLKAPVLIGVGAAFDFVSGSKRQSPKALQRLGLEWLFRLLSEPKRLWRRYLHYPEFVWLILMQALGLRSFPVGIHPGGEEDTG
jgi:N-acetylglucosaminyldiphosphoundecaprenol N-acetyl-beta-D-mannosaminyltransferase